MIIFSRSTLREALGGLRVLKLTKQPQPIHQHVLVSGLDNLVSIDATDLDQHLRYEGEGECTAVARVLVPFTILDTAGKTADANSEIRITGGEEPRINYQVSGTALDLPFTSLPCADFPERPVGEGSPIHLPEGVLGAMNEAQSCASTDPSRLTLNGVYLDSHAVVATDGRQLYRRNSLDLPLKKGAIFPGSQIPSILPDNAAQLWLWEQKDYPYAKISVGRWQWVTKLIKGAYPHYQQAIPKIENYAGSVRLSEADAERLKSVIPKLPGYKERESPVILRLSEKGAELRTIPRLPQVHLSLDRSEVVAPVETEVCFNSRYLLGALQRGLRDLRIRDRVSPLMITDTDRVHVWMPVHLAPANNPLSAAPVVDADAASTSDPSNESSVQVVSPEPASQASTVSRSNVSESQTTSTTMVASASNPSVSPAREGAAKLGVVAARVSSDAPASSGDAVQEKFVRVRDLLRELQSEFSGLQVLVREAGRQFKGLERDHENLKKNIRALR